MKDNQLFRSARLQIAIWYTITIMIICAFFSVIIYQDLHREIVRSLRNQRIRIELEQGFIPRVSPQSADPQLVDELDQRLAITLFAINAGILFVAGAASYLLAGKTLEPIEQMVKEQKRFIADASHELRTPLTALKTSLEVNLREKKLSSKDMHELLQSNLEDVNALQALSDRLLTLTQTQANQPLSLVPTLLHEVLDSARNRVQHLASVKDITIILPTTDEIVSGDRELLTDLFVILFDNAIKYSDSKRTITVTITKDVMATIAVTDYGVGIAKEDLPHIFEPFYRASKSRTRTDINGFGLGLSIAKQIVTQHKGKISVASIPGKETTFRVSLPFTN